MGKKFGQHFLIDQTVLARIADTVLGLATELGSTTLAEIGPGQGALTRRVMDDFDHLRLYEIDERMEPYLTSLIESHQDAKIIRGDVLKNSPPNPLPEKRGRHSEGKNTLVVGNLPYYITSPIFRKIFVEGSHIGGVFLIQKEVAQKMHTLAKQKSYLRWLLNYNYDITLEFLVSATAFDPPPKVQSAVVSLRRNSPPSPLSEKGGDPHPSPLPKGEGGRPDFDRMVAFLDIVSMYTRKTLRKIRKMRTDDLAGFTLPEELEGKRVQELTRDQLSKIV